MLLPALAGAGVSGRMPCSVSRASTSTPSRQPVPASCYILKPVRMWLATRTAVSLRSATAAGMSGSMTFPVSAARCGFCGPNVCDGARTSAVRGPRSSKSTRWQDPGRNSRPGRWPGLPTRSNGSTPLCPPWPTNSASPGTPPGTPSRQRPPAYRNHGPTGRRGRARGGRAYLVPHRPAGIRDGDRNRGPHPRRERHRSCPAGSRTAAPGSSRGSSGRRWHGTWLRPMSSFKGSEASPDHG